MDSLRTIVERVRAAAVPAAALPTAIKNKVLTDLAGRIETHVDALRNANAADLAAARQAGLSDAKLRRLALTDDAVRQLADGLRQIAGLPDPVGEVTADYTVPSGLRVRRVRCPLGVILMIYEARPNVTIDAFALCFKSGNACLLKGGREAGASNAALIDLARGALVDHHVPSDVVALVTSSDRAEMQALLGMHDLIDLVIPRGGVELIRFVHQHARMPMVQHFMGVCHLFVDADADLDRALDVCVTAKTSAPAACNAVETILVHESIAERFIPRLAERCAAAGVELRGDPRACELAPRARPAAEDDWGREFLDLVVAVRVIPGIDAAMEHIRRFGSNHTDAILSGSEANQARFVREVGSSCTLVNASTRFNDGYQLGLGAEIGISTSKIHAYGPMGLRELTAQRFVVVGDYHCR